MALLRKDLKIGFLAGASLLVLAVGYAMVLTFMSPDAPSGPASAIADPAVPDPSGGTPPESAQGAADPGEALQAGSAAEDEWSVYGFNGKAPVVTETPTQGQLPPGGAPPDNLTEDQLATPPDLNKDELINPAGTAAQPGTPPIADAAGASAAVRTHVVESGDNFSTIALKYYGDGDLFALIQKANPSVDSRKLKIGQKILVPDREAFPESKPATTAPGGADETASDANIHVVAAGETLAQIASERLGREKLWEELYKLNRDVIGSDPAKLKVGMRLKLPK